MKRITTMTIVTAATFAAVAAAWLWALRPLGFASYLSSTGATDTDIIRQYWPHRLVEPEWISATPDGLDRLMRWHSYETMARLSVVAALWLLVVEGFLYGVIRRRRVRPNHSLPRTRPSR
jgi:hypothetical protein